MSYKYFCKLCTKDANWNVWFEGCSGLYANYCDDHALQAIKEGIDGYKITQLTLIPDEEVVIMHHDYVRTLLAAKDMEIAEHTAHNADLEKRLEKWKMQASIYLALIESHKSIIFIKGVGDE